MAAPLRTVTASTGDPLAEAIELTRRLLAEETAGRDRANLHTRRKRAGFPAGKTFGDWDEQASSIPRPTQDALKTLEWVARRESLCVCGLSGTGKSHFVRHSGRPRSRPGSASRGSPSRISGCWCGGTAPTTPSPGRWPA